MKKYWALIIAAVVVFAYHYSYALSLLHLPDGTIIFNDYALLTYSGEAARAFHAESGALWGYDPHFMAGFPLTFIWNSNVFTQLACVAFPKADAALIVRAVAFMSMMLFPIFFYCTMRNFGLRRDQSLAGAAAGLLVFRLGVAGMFHVAGMVTAGMVTWFGLYLFSLLYRFMKHQDLPSALLLIVFSPLGLLIHKTVVVILAVPVLVLLIQNVRKLKLTSYIVLAAAAAGTLALNWFWLKPTFQFFKYKTFLTEAPFWQNRDLLRPLKDYFTLSMYANTVELSDRWWIGLSHTAMLWVLLIGGMAGLVLWRRNGRGDLALPVAVTAAFFFVFGYFGAFVQLFAEVNPTRYLPVMNLLLLIPATTAMLHVYRGIGSRITANGLFLAVALGVCMVSFFHLQRFDKLLQLRTGEPETREVTQLINELRAMPPQGRVLLEDSGVMDHEGPGQVYAMSHIPALFPQKTGKAFIGGPYPYVFVKHHWTDFHDGKIFGRNMDDVPFRRMKKYMALYDITRIVCWSSRARDYFNAYPDYFRPEKNVGYFQIYTVARKPDSFLRGSGTARATYNRIELTDVKPEGGEIIIKYHWLDSLRTDPPLKISSVRFMDDPIGFIRIQNPPPALKIVNP